MAVIHVMQIKDSGGMENFEKYDLFLKTLCTSIEGTIPGNRDFGMDADCLSEAPDVAINLFAADLQEKIEKFLPEIEIADITWTAHEDGSLTPVVSIKKKEGQDD